MTPLHIAVSHGRLQCTRALLDAKANVSHQSSFGSTLLHNAAETGNHVVYFIIF